MTKYILYFDSKSQNIVLKNQAIFLCLRENYRGKGKNIARFFKNKKAQNLVVYSKFNHQKYDFPDFLIFLNVA